MGLPHYYYSNISYSSCTTAGALQSSLTHSRKVETCFCCKHRTRSQNIRPAEENSRRMRKGTVSCRRDESRWNATVWYCTQPPQYHSRYTNPTNNKNIRVRDEQEGTPGFHVLRSSVPARHSCIFIFCQLTGLFDKSGASQEGGGRRVPVASQEESQ